MNDQTQYNPVSKWRTIVVDVQLLSGETNETPAKYYIKVKPIDINEYGAIIPDLAIGFYVKDIAEHAYRITAVNIGGNPNKIEIEDSFRCGQGPQPMRQAVVYRSFGYGITPFLFPDKESNLLWKYANLINVRWHPRGVIPVYVPADAEIETPAMIVHSGGEIVVHHWDYIREKVVPEVQTFPRTVSGALGTPAFILVDQDIPELTTVIPVQRDKGIRRMRFMAECENALSVIYSIDETSILGGVIIDSQTGVVEFPFDYIGDTTITATFTGKNSTAKTTEHTITTIEPAEGEFVAFPSQTFNPDEKYKERKWAIGEGYYSLSDDDIYYIYAKLPVYDDEMGEIVVTKEYLHEGIFENHLLILMGVLNSAEQGRVLVLLWGNGGTAKTGGGTQPPSVQIRWTVISESCLVDEEMNNTGQQEVIRKKEKYNTETQTWEDAGETTKDIVTNHSDCPPPAPDPYRAAQFVGLVWDANSAQEISFSVGTMKKVNTMTAAGNNYLFLSIPTALSFNVVDGTGVDITDMFVSVGTDNKTGYQPNTVWRKNPKYSSGAVLKIHLTIY